jgi:ELWxxDGT repeat protein
VIRGTLFDVIYPQNLTTAGDTVFLLALGSSGEHDPWELWRSDGSEQGTVLVMTQNQESPLERPAQMTATKDALYFTLKRNEASAIPALWRCSITDSAPGEVWSHDQRAPRELTALAGDLYFLAAAASGTDELWRYTSTGAQLVSRLQLAGSPAHASQLTAAGNRLFFVVTTELTGPELWISDGSAAGTGLVRDIAVGPVGSYPQALHGIGDYLLFAADDGRSGLELWASDGTSSGTVLIADISPGWPASSPQSMTLVGEVVLFTAQQESGSRELWHVPLVTISELVSGSDQLRSWRRPRRLP